MNLPSNCSTYNESKITVKEIIIPNTNEVFYYKKDTKNKDINLYIFNKKINGYTPMPRNHIYYGKLMEKILEDDL